MRTLLGIVAMVAVIALSTEWLLRAGIALGVGNLANPANYAQPFCGDDFHKLRFLWKTQGALKSGRHDQHPRYGWVRTEGERELQAVTIERPHIAVFGDSFMAGVQSLAPEERIARQLEERLTEGSVADYSVAGYGVDQIYLRFSDVVADPERRPDVAVVGIFLGDIDRVVERFRAGPKPYFELAGDTLELGGVPIELSPEEWLERHPPAIHSYALAVIDMRTRPARGFQIGVETDCLRPEKEEITRRLLRRMVDEAERNGVELVFLINYGSDTMPRTSWREPFLRDTLIEMGANFVDVKEVLQRAAERESVAVDVFFMPGRNNHYGARGNRAIVEAVLERLRGDST